MKTGDSARSRRSPVFLFHSCNPGPDPAVWHSSQERVPRGSPNALVSSKPESVSASDESELVQRAKRGDDDAFTRLALLYRGRITGTAARFARGRHELEDLVQDIFIRAWKGLGQFREDAPFEHWIMRIAVRTCYDFLRRHRRRRECEVLVDEMPPAARDTAIQPSDGDEERRRRDAWETLRRLLDQLGEKDRLAVTLIDLEQKSVKEAAALTGWSESNVKVRAFRARKRLQEIHRQQSSKI